MAVGRGAQPHRLVEHRVQDRREVAGRGLDGLQDFGCRGLRLSPVATRSRERLLSEPIAGAQPFVRNRSSCPIPDVRHPRLDRLS
jgi:hypothetical protein